MASRKSGKPCRPGGGASESVRDPAKRETLKKLAALGALALLDAGALSSCARRSLPTMTRERKVIVLGIDGLDARPVRRMMAEGKLPNMARLQSLGGFDTLTSTVPPQSPVAWASFITGRDPGGHGIYDFIQRDPETYLPYLAIARTREAERTLRLGKWRLPLSRGTVELLRGGRAFWDLLAEQGVPGAVYRVPSNFPPQGTEVKQLAGLGAPDLRGTYGMFSFYEEAPVKGAEEVVKELTGGTVYEVPAKDGRIRGRLRGPENTLRKDSPDTTVDFEVYADRSHGLARIAVQGQEILLREGEWSDWVALRFEMIPRVKHVSGICRFYLKAVSPRLKLYVTPVNIDPMEPALPITAPLGFARELAEKLGRFYTQGFPHDVKALRHGILDDGEYLHQSGLAMGEARRMYESALEEFRRGLLFYYFSTSDRTQHMFWRTMDARHPAHDERVAREFGSAIEDCYRSSDELVGLALEACDRDTTLIVLSDHGFAPYYRGFNVNTWLADNGYLMGRGLRDLEADIFSRADWPNTLAYGLGFNGVYLNLLGRERYGKVGPEERAALAQHLADELRRVRDPETGDRVIEDVYLAEDVYSPDTRDRAPDLVLGFAHGYRCADESVLGELTHWVTAENRDRWSGDHCVDRSLVPGILLCNRPLGRQAVTLPDVTAMVLAEFGQATDGTKRPGR